MRHRHVRKPGRLQATGMAIEPFVVHKAWLLLVLYFNLLELTNFGYIILLVTSSYNMESYQWKEVQTIHRYFVLTYSGIDLLPLALLVRERWQNRDTVYIYKIFQ